MAFFPRTDHGHPSSIPFTWHGREVSGGSSSTLPQAPRKGVMSAMAVIVYPVCVNLHQARLKIKRADHHIDKLEARIMALYETDHSMVTVDPKSGEETRGPRLIPA